jgi:hypothetical protein
MRRTRENDAVGQSGVVGGRDAKKNETVGVCVALIVNTNVTTTPKAWTPFGITPDGRVLPFGPQRKSPRRDVVADSSA